MTTQDMAKRSVTIAARLSPKEKEYVQEAAARRNQPVAHMIYDLTMQEVAKLKIFEEGNRQQATK